MYLKKATFVYVIKLECNEICSFHFVIITGNYCLIIVIACTMSIFIEDLDLEYLFVLRRNRHQRRHRDWKKALLDVHLRWLRPHLGNYFYKRFIVFSLIGIYIIVQRSLYKHTCKKRNAEGWTECQIARRTIQGQTWSDLRKWKPSRLKEKHQSKLSINCMALIINKF